MVEQASSSAQILAKALPIRRAKQAPEQPGGSALKAGSGSLAVARH
jgi:hypothetical protein